MDETLSKFFLEQAPLLVVVGTSLYLIWRVFIRYEDKRNDREDKRLDQQRDQLMQQGLAYREYVSERDEKMARMFNDQTKRWQDFLDSQSAANRQWMADLTRELQLLRAEIATEFKQLQDTSGQQSVAIDTVLRMLVNGWKDKIKTGPLDKSE